MKISALIGNNGEQIIASSRGTKLNSHKLKAKAKDTCTIKKKSWIKWFHKCGHFASVFYKLDIYGEVVQPKFKWLLDKCPECALSYIKEKTIRCALCTLPIMPGAAVALYSLKSKGLSIKHATIIDNSALGCLRWDCCPSGGYYCGNWDGKGIKSPW